MKYFEWLNRDIARERILVEKTAVLLYPQFSEYELTVALYILMQGKKPVVTVGINKQLKKDYLISLNK